MIEVHGKMQRQQFTRGKRGLILLMMLLLAVALLLMGAICPGASSPSLPVPQSSHSEFSPFNATDISQLKMVDENNGWATTPQSVLKTTDGGQTWTDVTPTDWAQT